MAMPTLERSYEFNVNWLHETTGNDYTDRRWKWLHMHDVMTAWSSSPWTVVGSCNGSTSGWPGPGWDTINDIVWGANYSWVVLESVNGQQILVSLSSVNDLRHCLFFSPDGSFSGGAPGEKPLTNANYVVLTQDNVETSYPWQCGSAAVDTYTHMIHSTDGELDVLLHTYNGRALWAWVFTKIDDAGPSFTLPWAMWGYTSGTSSTDTKCEYYDGAHGWGNMARWKGFRASGGVGEFTASVGTDGLNNAWSGTMFDAAAHYISGRYPMHPLVLNGCDSDSYGVHGRIADIYATGSPPGSATGDSFEANSGSPTREWILFGNFVFLWNGSVPLITPP